jgi:hypothetical protein
MNKLKLNVEALEVESFRTADQPASHGTVFGADGSTIPPYCFTYTCGDSQIRPCKVD